MAVTTDNVLATKIDAQALVDDVMRRWPATVGVFIRLRMKCVGCPFGVFHSIEHACQEHALQVETALAALERRLARPD